MKSPIRIALLAAALSVTGLTALLADDTSDSTPTPKHHGHHGEGMLTPDEQAQLKKDRDAAFAADPSLQAEEKSLHDQMHEHMEKVEAAILKQDPSAAPLIAKMKAGHHGPPPDAN